MAEKSFDDNDQSVYKTHILYYLPSDANCARLMVALEAHPLFDDVFLQDVSQLRQRPPWLDGVPILVCKKDNQAFKGQHIQNYMKSYQTDEFQPANTMTGGWSSYEDGETSMEKRFSTLHDPSLFDLEEEGGAAPAQQPAPAQSQQPLNEKQMRKKHSEVEAQQRAQQMIDVRQRQDQMLQARSKGSSIVPTPRNAFSNDDGQPVVRHPPPVPATMHQRAADMRQPQYGQPQHYAQQATPTQVPQFYAQQAQQQQYYAPPQQQPQQQYYYAPPQQPVQQQYYEPPQQQYYEPPQQQYYAQQQPAQQQYYSQYY